MSDVVADRRGAVLVCRLNRPEARNGLTGVLLGEYLAVLEEARTDDAVRVVVTTGEGAAFSAGADMGDLASETARKGLNALMHENLGLTTALSAADRTFDRLGVGRETLAIKNYDKPLIAAVNGAAAGGGFALAMLHDIRFASERATFTSAFVRIGLVAEMGLSYTLPRAIGLEAAMDVMYTGRSVGAEEARALGLVRRVVAHDRLMEEALAYADQIAAQAPIAVQFAKRALTRSLENTLGAQLELEWPYQVAAFDTDDAREGIAAFRERRPPRFSGS
ncbi:MAG: 2-(1,2-epoxy,2-dihydrophenyl)acetyl-CoA isomerase [Mycobacterium sp.]|jgi:enoyl-CoA hydratase/carnithine racemase|uniref:enoyl-CoA hydratase/isomerase family protein n=1 Tax=Mycobacterium sp. TaxID=1785 RepID=UPI0028BC4E75|nr:2-(1,2-epoxy,2-dihydrophenyl)acetyl-CoA isomerase [Mycobacterium sp.]